MSSVPQFYRSLFRHDQLLGHKGIPGMTIERFNQRHNNFGFRGEDFGILKGLNTKRIAILGDSQVWGWALSDSETISGHLTNKISKLFPESENVEVLNLGVPGYSLEQEFIQYLSICTQLDIDHVVLAIFAGNDFDEFSKEVAWGMPRPTISMVEGKARINDVPITDNLNWSSIPIHSLVPSLNSVKGVSSLIDFIGNRRLSPSFECALCVTSQCTENCELFSVPRRIQRLKEYLPEKTSSSMRSVASIQEYSDLLFTFRDRLIADGVGYTVIALPPARQMATENTTSRYSQLLTEASSRDLNLIDAGKIAQNLSGDFSNYELDGYHFNSDFNRALADLILKDPDLVNLIGLPRS